MDVVRDREPELDEAMFVDAVTRNLRRGQLLLLIAGDGIQENVGAITKFIEEHGTLHFTFGLVEIAIYVMPDGSRLVQPRIFAQSTILRRIVVEMRDGQLTELEEPDEEQSPEPPGPNPKEKFWAEFRNAYPLDNKSQPLRPPSKGTNQFYYMPEGSDGWICAVIAPGSESAGVYLNFRRGPIADRIFAALSEDRAAIDEALGQPVDWHTTDKGQGVSIWRNFGNRMFDERRAEVQAWLGEVLNRFVNVFRPRIESLLLEQ